MSNTSPNPIKVMRIVADWVIDEGGQPYLLEIQRAANSGLKDLSLLLAPPSILNEITFKKRVEKKTGVDATLKDHPILTLIAGGGGAGDKRFAALLLQSLKSDDLLPCLLPSAIFAKVADLEKALDLIFENKSFWGRGIVSKKPGSGSRGNTLHDTHQERVPPKNRQHESPYGLRRDFGGILQPFVVTEARKFGELTEDRVASIRSYHTVVVYDDGTVKQFDDIRFWVAASKPVRYLEDGFPDLSHKHAEGLLSNTPGTENARAYLHPINDDDPLVDSINTYMLTRVTPQLEKLMEKPFIETMIECAVAVAKRNIEAEIMTFADMVFHRDTITVLKSFPIDQRNQLINSLLLTSQGLGSAQKKAWKELVSGLIKESLMFKDPQSFENRIEGLNDEAVLKRVRMLSADERPNLNNTPET